MTYRLTREIKVEDGYDVLVAGGGPAGVSAAICAARLGAKVLLLEATGALGGMGTSGLVCAYDPMSDGERPLVGGFMRELVDTMYARNFMSPHVTPDFWINKYHRWSQFKPEGLKLLLDELTCDAGVEVRFFTRVIDAEANADSGEVNGVVLHNIEGYSFVKAKTYIDATGDAVLSALCGAEYREAGRDTPYPMPSTLCALFAGVDWEKSELKTQTPEAVELIEKEFESGLFEQLDRHFVGISQIGETVGYMNGGHIFNLLACNIRSLTDGMMTGRRIVRQYEAFLKKYSENCANLELIATAPLMGVRESRRVVGEYELKFEDYLARRQFPDQIGVFNKFVDIHPADCSREAYDKFTEEINYSGRLGIGECFGIPYGILVPRGWKNLWVAGRCGSSDTKVNGSIRVMPACAMMGQAAGTAAVQAIKTDMNAAEIDTAELVAVLRSNGAFLPQESLTHKLTTG